MYHTYLIYRTDETLMGVASATSPYHARRKLAHKCGCSMLELAAVRLAPGDSESFADKNTDQDRIV